MSFKKEYGVSRVERCPFCKRQGITKNSQGIPVCQHHKDSVLNQFKCFCGENLDLMTGKYGAFFKCFKCGNINFNKALEINTVEDVNNPSGGKGEDKSSSREETVMPDDPRYFG